MCVSVTAISAVTSDPSAWVTTMPRCPGSFPIPILFKCSRLAIAARAYALGVDLRQGVEEIDDARLQGVLRADDHESGLLNELLNDVRTVPQVLHRRLDIGADRR